MTAEEFLGKQVTYEFTKGSNHPPEKFVPYDVALAALQLKEYEVITDNERKGWVCPVCGKVYAPSVSECCECIGEKGETGFYYLYLCKLEDVLAFPKSNMERRVFEGNFRFKEGKGFVKYKIPKCAMSKHWLGLGKGLFEGIITINVSKLSREMGSNFLYRFNYGPVIGLVYDSKMECFFSSYNKGDVSHDLNSENGRVEHLMKISTGPTIYFDYYMDSDKVDVICELE